MKKKNIGEPVNPAKIYLPNRLPRYVMYLAGTIFYLTVFFVPLFPDEKIVRLKLLVFELGVLTTLWLSLSSQILAGKITLSRLTLNLPILTGLGYVIILYLFSPDKPAAVSELHRVLLCTGCYFIPVLWMKSINQFNRIVWVWLASAILVILYGLGQHFGGVSLGKFRVDIPQMDRIMSTFGNPIFLAVFLVTTIPLTYYIIFTRRSFGIKTLSLLFYILFILTLFYTKTRAAWLGTAFAILIFAYLNLKSGKLKLIFTVIFLVLGTLFLFFTWNVWLRFQQHPLIWRDTLRMWLSRPVFGIGLGVFHLYFPKYAGADLVKIFPPNQFIVNDAHNEYLQILAESGTCGFAFFTWLIISFYRLSTDRIKQVQNKLKVNIFSFPEEADELKHRFILLTSLIAAATGILIQNIFSVDMRFIISAGYLYLILGLTTATVNLESFKEFKVNLWIGILGFVLITGFAGFLAWKSVQPYVAHRKLAATPDFFEEKLADPQTTISELETLAQQYPEDSRVWEKLGWVYAKEKKFDLAIASLEKSAHLNPTLYGPYNNIGNIYFTIGNREKAIEYYRKSLTIKPDQIDAHTNLGIAYYYAGKLKEASDEFKAVLTLDPNNEKAIVMYKKMVE